MTSLRQLNIQNKPLPKLEPRCFGRACEERTGCKRYGQVLYERDVPHVRKGVTFLMSMRDDDGVCRRKL